MGYDIHITRAPGHWAINEGYEIAVEEWLRFVEEDPELALSGPNGDYVTSWEGESRYPDPWFQWSRGNIETKNPDAPIIRKMVLMAERLHARVQGDDGEIYLPDGKVERDGRIMEGQDWDWRTY